MTKQLTETQVTAYHRDGFVYPVPVMSAEESWSYRARLEAFEGAHPDYMKGMKRHGIQGVREEGKHRNESQSFNQMDHA